MPEFPQHEGHAAAHVRRNIDRVLDLEKHAARSKSVTEAAIERVGRFVGTLAFVGVHLAILIIWIALNSGGLHWVKPFDPYPYNFLSMLACYEAVILSAFVLMAQNRMTSLASRRDHFDLQVNLMAEQEASITIQMLDRISRKLGVTQDNADGALALSRTSSLEHLVDELHARLPEANGETPPQTDTAPAPAPDQANA